MAEDIRREEIRHFMMEDGRRGEKRVKEEGDTKFTEVHVEPLKFNLLQKVKEVKRPVVCRRETENYDETGNLVGAPIIEDLEPTLQVVEQPVAPMYATKYEMQELKSAIEALGDAVTKKPARMVSSQSLEDVVQKVETTVKNADVETRMSAIFLTAFIVEVAILGWVVFFAQ